MEKELEKYKIIEHVKFGGNSFFTLSKKNEANDWICMLSHSIRATKSLSAAKKQLLGIVKESVKETKEHFVNHG